MTIRWSAATEFVFHVGVLGQAAYLADPLKQVLEVWLVVGLVMLPYLLLLFFRHGELKDETVRRAHVSAALWYLALSAVVVVLAARGYRPPGWLLYLAAMTPGAVISLLLLRRHLGGPPTKRLPAS